MNATRWLALALLTVLFSLSAPVAAKDREPLDQVFEQTLAMFQDLSVDKFFELAGVPAQYRTKIDFDPTKAKYFDLMNNSQQFSNKELARLKKSGFFVRDTGWYGGFGISYYNIYANDLPVLVTTDSILHALHKSYDDILQELEELYLSPAIERVLEATREEVRVVAAGNRNPDLAESLADADLYLTVALSLLDGQARPTLLDQDETVATVLAKVASLEMQVPLQDPPIRLFGKDRWIDFSQFKPRGHYTQSEELSNYFRCLMWLGRADTGMNVLETPRQLRTAALLVLALNRAGELETLREVDEIVGFMVGRSDNLTVFGMQKLLGELGLKQVRDLTNADKLSTVLQAIKEGRAGTQFIRSQMVVSWPDDTIKVAPPSLFQLFGQRYILDSFVLSKVVFDDIIYKGRKQERFMPSPLDVMAAFGNREALALLKDELKRWHYSANLKATQDFVASHRPEFWQENLYNIWLAALRTLHRPMTDKHAPQSMQTRAWQRKQLNTQLASWAQLRHDTILYAKQSYTAVAGCDYPDGYVEPYPEFYKTLGTFAARAQELLGNAAILDDEARKRYRDFFGNMHQTMTRLRKMAVKELAAQPFSRSDRKFLDDLIRRRAGKGYGATPVYNGWYVDLFYGGQDAAIEWDPTVADVHTDPNSRQVLEVGVGRVNVLFLAVDSQGDKSMVAGPTFSYYEFTQPASDRMTDPEWRDRIQQGKAPAPPAWTESFLVR